MKLVSVKQSDLVILGLMFNSQTIVILLICSLNDLFIKCLERLVWIEITSYGSVWQLTHSLNGSCEELFEVSHLYSNRLQRSTPAIQLQCDQLMPSFLYFRYSACNISYTYSSILFKSYLFIWVLTTGCFMHTHTVCNQAQNLCAVPVCCHLSCVS